MTAGFALGIVFAFSGFLAIGAAADGQFMWALAFLAVAGLAAYRAISLQGRPWRRCRRRKRESQVRP